MQYWPVIKMYLINIHIEISHLRNLPYIYGKKTSFIFLQDGLFIVGMVTKWPFLRCLETIKTNQ